MTVASVRIRPNSRATVGEKRCRPAAFTGVAANYIRRTSGASGVLRIGQAEERTPSWAPPR